MVLSTNRHTNGVWMHHGKLMVCSQLELYAPTEPPGQSATLELPDGIITTSMLAPGAAQEQIGSFIQLIAWTLPATNVWTETPVQVNITFSDVGTRVRVEFSVMVSSPTKGHRIAYGIMVDGVAPQNGALGALDVPENNFAVMASGTFYFTNQAAISRRIAFGLYGPTGAQIYDVIASTLYVTEQRR